MHYNVELVFPFLLMYLLEVLCHAAQCFCSGLASCRYKHHIVSVKKTHQKHPEGTISHQP